MTIMTQSDARRAGERPPAVSRTGIHPGWQRAVWRGRGQVNHQKYYYNAILHDIII